MINQVATNSIEFYQKNISPYKGYSCAYRYFTGEDSCSEFTRKSILKYGVIRSIPLLIKQIKLCKATYLQHKAENSTNGYEKFCNGCGAISPCI